MTNSQRTAAASASTVSLHYETQHVAVVTIDNPPANTFSWQSRNDFVDILDELDATLGASIGVAFSCVRMLGDGELGCSGLSRLVKVTKALLLGELSAHLLLGRLVKIDRLSIPA